MKVTLQAQVGNGDAPADADHPPAIGGPSSGSDFNVGSIPRSLRVLLASYVGIAAALVTWLSIWNATLTRSVWDLFGLALLIGISITCMMAFFAIVRNSNGVLMTTIMSQVFIACLAAYVWVIDQRSPVGQLRGVTGVALTLGGIAVLWVLYLGRYARGAVTKCVAVVVALFPLVGVAQFWMQTEYLPNALGPHVDVQAELSPVGSTGPTIHVLAKVTMHNRGSTRVDVHAGLIRVMSYRVGTPTQPATAETVAAFLDPYGGDIEYRETPNLPKDSRLLYAKLITSAGNVWLLPGETTEYKAVIDVDSRGVRLVRLSVEAFVVTHRLMQEPHTCDSRKVSRSQDPVGFFDGAALQDWQTVAGLRAMCAEIQFVPRGAIHALVSDDPVSRTFVMVDDPNPVPMLYTQFGTHATSDAPLPNVDEMRKVSDAHPSGVVSASAEYAPADGDLPDDTGSPG